MTEKHAGIDHGNNNVGAITALTGAQLPGQWQVDGAVVPLFIVTAVVRSGEGGAEVVRFGQQDIILFCHLFDGHQGGKFLLIVTAFCRELRRGGGEGQNAAGRGIKAQQGRSLLAHCAGR